MDTKELSNTRINGKKKTSSSIPALIFAGVISGLAIGISVLSAPFMLPFFRKICLPYVPATTIQVENVLRALKSRRGKVIDLGSGDGRLVIAAAKRGFQSTGVELNPWLIAYSKLAAYREGVHREVKFRMCDLWKVNLRPYQNVIIFGVETMMDDLEAKFIKELDKGACIVACRFPLKNHKPVQIIGNRIDTVWVYKVN